MGQQKNPYIQRLEDEMLPKILKGEVAPYLARIEAAWFRDHGSSIPMIALARFNRWRQTRGRRLSPISTKDLRRYLIQMLVCAVGVKEPTADAYLRGEEYYRKKEGKVRTRFNHQTHAWLDEVTSALGFPVPRWSYHDIEERPWSGRLAIFTELASLPSQRFHFDLIRAIAHEARENHCLCSVHEVSRERLAHDIATLMRLFDPDAAILLRLTPDGLCLSALDSTPTILVHADRGPCRDQYPPIVCNIVPDQQSIGPCLMEFLKGPGTVKRAKRGTTVVASIEMEHKPGSIRDERICLVLQALGELGLAPRHCIVQDYSFANAIRVFKAFPNASLYVCLSDQLALGIKHCLIASGREYKRRVVGWDNSEQYAQRENITSFDQGLRQIASKIFEELIGIIKYEQAIADDPTGAAGKPAKPAFKEVGIPVELAQEESGGYPQYVRSAQTGGLYPTFRLL
jgi:DNA-binding LacI/PurR family transcriptional regulator